MPKFVLQECGAAQAAVTRQGLIEEVKYWAWTASGVTGIAEARRDQSQHAQRAHVAECHRLADLTAAC